jgi:hypothetical protein
MKPIRLAYVAGFFDGEGSVYIIKTSKRQKIYHNICVRLTNTDKHIMILIKKWIGFGTIFMRKKLLHRKRAYDFILKGRQGESFLKSILPFLIVKKKQALLALKFMSMKHKRFGGKNPKHILTDKEINQREAIRTKIRKLNRGSTQ